MVVHGKLLVVVGSSAAPRPHFQLQAPAGAIVVETSPSQRKLSGRISRKLQRIGTPSEVRPSCTMSSPCARPICVTYRPSEGSAQVIRHCPRAGSYMRSVLP